MNVVEQLSVKATCVMLILVCLESSQANAQFTQQGNKLVGANAVGEPMQGVSVSLSSDGNTAVVGGFQDNNLLGAAWVFTRSGGAWSQQGGKLVGTGGAGTFLQQGLSVSLSGDGNTAIVGSNWDNSNAGATWVYTRTGGVWSQQGNKLVGTGAVGAAAQGRSVSLSSDGNTAIVGGIDDNRFVGAAWVYTRVTSGVDDPSGEVPQQFGLYVNFPNPFNPSTTIRYELPHAAHVTLRVYNTLGQEVATLVNENRSAGVYTVKFNATNLSSGVYFYRLQAGDFVQTKKLLLLR